MTGAAVRYLETVRQDFIWPQTIGLRTLTDWHAIKTGL